MNLKNLPDEILIQKTESLVQQERELLTAILHHLREIEARRLFSALGHPSLFDYAVKKLGYSDDQAARRISAMRLMRDVPEVEAKLESGALTLTNASLAQSFFRREKVKPAAAKLELLSQLEHKSTREAERIVNFNTLAPSEIEFRFVADAALREKLERVKGLLANSHPQCTMGELIDKLCNLAIEKLTPTKRPLGAPLSLRNKRAEVWRRARNQCENCGSKHALQVDHIRPRALGGTDELDNLRLLCRSCNQRAAIEKLGLTKMRPYLEFQKSVIGAQTVRRETWIEGGRDS